MSGTKCPPQGVHKTRRVGKTGRTTRCVYPRVCLKCSYHWDSRVEHPKECPQCKNRNWKQENMMATACQKLRQSAPKRITINKRRFERSGMEDSWKFDSLPDARKYANFQAEMNGFTMAIMKVVSGCAVYFGPRNARGWGGHVLKKILS